MVNPSRPTAAQPRGRGFWVMRDLPTLVWLALLVVATLTHRMLPAASWLMLHLLFLGAMTHAILVWSQHFSFALTRSRQSARDRWQQNARLVAANVGIAVILIGVPLAVWPLTVAGVTLLSAAVVWHGVDLWRRMRGALPGRFTKTLRYYVASAAFLPLGAGLGAWLTGPASPGGGVVLAHAITNVLGWMGLTVAGTVVTLWPTMLRTRAADSAARDAARALPVLAASVVVAALGAAFGLVPIVALGLAGYAAGLLIIGVALFAAARGATPKSFATLSVGAALVWWFTLIVILVVWSMSVWVAGGSVLGGDIAQLRVAIDWAAPFLAAGFAAQVLLGALSYLVPVVLGGGPAAVRAGTTAFDAGGTLRIATANAALFVCALPVTSVMRVAASVIYLVAMASFLPLFLRALRQQKNAKRAAEAAFAARAGEGDGSLSPQPAGAQPAGTQPTGTHPAGSQPARTQPAGVTGGLQVGSRAESGLAPIPAPETRRGPLAPEGAQPTGRRSGQAMLGLAAVILVTALAGAADPHALTALTRDTGAAASITSGSGSATDSTADAPVQTVQVTAANMRFSPSRIEVPVGTRLVIELTNTDEEQPHDLVFENGRGGERLAPGASATIDVGVITANVAGWCSIIGHRQMGMTLDVVATGDASATGTSPGTADDAAKAAGSGSHDMSGMYASSEATGAAGLVDLMAGSFGSDFTARDAALAPLPASAGPLTHRITLPVSELSLPVAPGRQGPVQQQLWTFGGTVPGPVLHGRVGDTFEVTLINDGTIGHSIDFHAGALAPDKPMRTIAPGEQLTYTFTATRSGIWMYHCSTMPMSAHIANGMFGAVIIEPDDLPEVDHSYVLVQSEYYLGGSGIAGGTGSGAAGETGSGSGSGNPGEVDMDKLAAERPDVVTFNGVAGQYAHEPLTAKVGERVRVWLLNVGPNRASSFHVIGGQFDTVWSEGRFLINRATDTGSQALALQPAQGGYVELVFPEAGNYPFVSHVMIDAERGASGVFRVSK